MSYPGMLNIQERWQRFCRIHQSLVSQLASLALAFRSAARFEELLQSGATQAKDQQATLESLSGDEWPVFAAFVTHFSHD